LCTPAHGAGARARVNNSQGAYGAAKLLPTRLKVWSRPRPRPLYNRSMMIASSAAAFQTPRLLFRDATHIIRLRSGGHAARIPVAFETVNDRRSESQPDAHRNDALSRRVWAVINSS